MGYSEHDLDRLNSLDGPELIAVISEDQAFMGETEWHTHPRGQFMYLERGMICITTRTDVWVLLPHRIGWLPPGVEHTARIVEPVSTWGVWVAPDAAAGLPSRPSMLRGNQLLRELVRRAADWAHSDQLDIEQQRLMSVLMDEMRRSVVPESPITLPMPDDRRLRQVAEALLRDPGDTRTRDEWAACAGLSTRSLSRRFHDETGMTFVQWRQQVRLARALEQLAKGEPVACVADALGYASVSAFVAMFRRSVGQSPGKYLDVSDMGAPLSVA
ncbi:MAG TPA: helix-turn-helix transcriptional regulator [Oleiagrimonas sp.]|nr:helix-turn-helix transcriptional regulator [Oleiagrimonas sp.]